MKKTGSASQSQESEHSNHFVDQLETLRATLKEDVPSSKKINTTPSATENSDEIVSVYNKSMEKYVESVQKSMSQRHKLQKPILDCIKRLLNVLIWSFNIIIGVIVIFSALYCFRNSDDDLLIQLLDFLKYYVGAVVVELLGMLYFVTKSVFSPEDITGLGDLLKSNSQQSSEE